MPSAVMTRLDLYLMSIAQGRIPQGAYQSFFTERVEEFFAKLAAVTDHEPEQEGLPHV
jgi:hypothetical protein